MYVKEATNEEGKIEIEGLKITGKISVQIKEIEGPKGYELDGRTKEIIYTRNEENKEIEINEKGETIETKTDENKKNVEIIVGNEIVENYENLKLQKFVSKINAKEIEGNEPKVTVKDRNNITYEGRGQKLEVSPKDEITYTIRIYNEGTKGGKGGKITDYIPEGLIFLGENEINQKYGWKLSKDGSKVETEAAKEIPGFEYPEMKEPQYEDIKIVFKVDKKLLENKTIINIAEREEDRPGRYEDGSDDEEEMEYKYVDISTNKYISKMTKEGEEIALDVESSKAGKLIKYDISRKEAKGSKIKIEYTIEITNKGNKEGKVGEIIDNIPEKVTFNKEGNKGWEIEEGKAINRTLVNETIKPNETKAVKIVLEWTNESENYGTITNHARVVSEEAISQEDDEDMAEIIVAVKTGQAKTYIMLAMGVISILALGVYGINKYVVEHSL